MMPIPLGSGFRRNDGFFVQSTVFIHSKNEYALDPLTKDFVMSYRLYQNVIIVSVIFISLLIVFPIALWEKQEKIEAVQGWEANVTEGTYVVWFDRITTEEDRECYLAQNPDRKLPVLVFYAGDVIDYTEPKGTIYVVIWEDGTIVWGAPNEGKPVIRNLAYKNQDIKYFMSQIDSGKVHELLLDLENSLVLLDYLLFPIGTCHVHLGFRVEEARTFSIDTIDGFQKIFSALTCELILSEKVQSVKSAQAWRRMVNKIFSMIPSESRPVNISYSRYDCDDPYSWIGIIEIPKE